MNPLKRSKKRIAVPQKPWWQTMWAIVGSLPAFALAIYTLVPHLSIYRDDSSDAGSPLAQSFYVENDGFLPATKVSAACLGNAKAKSALLNLNYGDNTTNFPNLADTISYHGKKTIPCDRASTITGFAFDDGSTLSISVAYNWFWIPIHWKQTFPTFTSYRGRDGKYHWRY